MRVYRFVEKYCNLINMHDKTFYFKITFVVIFFIKKNMKKNMILFLIFVSTQVVQNTKIKSLSL